MFRTSGVGFHTKGYLFHNGNDIRIIVGSSNLTQNAITRNFEWNTRVVSTSDGQYAKDIEAEFNSVWESSVDYNSCREEYERQYQEAKSQKAALTKIVTSLDLSYSKVISPNTMQKGFMSEIERLIKAGESRALLVSATGTGKTYASAFAVRGVFANELIHKKKVLFLSHREMINSQAEKSFRRVLGESFTTAQLSGNSQDLAKIKSANILFATMNMMAKDSFVIKISSVTNFQSLYSMSVTVPVPRVIIRSLNISGRLSCSVCPRLRTEPMDSMSMSCSTIT